MAGRLGSYLWPRVPRPVRGVRHWGPYASIRKGHWRLINAPDGPKEGELAELIEASAWLLAVLTTVRNSALPNAWVGAGVLRDLVWGERYGTGFDPRDVRDVDVAFFDPENLRRERDRMATDQLHGLLPEVPWEATNQAAVHTWYPEVFGGGPVAPLRSIADAVATWPETATSVVIRLDHAGVLRVCAPFGLDDLLGGVWRRNPRRITVADSRARLARHQPSRRWPGIRVLQP